MVTRAFSCDLDLLIEVRIENGLIDGVQFYKSPEKSKLICVIRSYNFDIKGSVRRTPEIYPEVNKAIFAWFEDYAQRKAPTVDLPIVEMPESLFSWRVLNRLKSIPYGDRITYKELALLAGSPRAERAAGTACHINRIPLFIPCHRVIRSDGKLGGYAYGPMLKRRLLAFEKPKK